MQLTVICFIRKVDEPYKGTGCSIILTNPASLEFSYRPSTNRGLHPTGFSFSIRLVLTPFASSAECEAHAPQDGVWKNASMGKLLSKSRQD